MDTLTSKTLDAYLQAAETSLVSANTLRQMMEPKSIEQRIDDATSWEELGRIVWDEVSNTTTIPTVQAQDGKIKWDKYAPDYARKRTQSQSREDQKMEGSGEPFTPPVSTEDAVGL